MEQKIKKWLNEQGYPLEFQVANEFIKNKFRVIQSDYYSDPETNENREMDVVAHKQLMIDNVLFRITIIVECKAGKDKPWLLFSTTDSKLGEMAKIAQTPGTLLGREFLSILSEDKKYQSMNLFSMGERRSFGITQCFTSGKDIPYQAMKGVAKATDSICKFESDSPKTLICDIVFPLIVIQAPLFDSYYEGDVNLSEIESGTIAWRNTLMSMPHSIIKVQKFSAFEKILPIYTNEIETIFNDTMNNDLLAKAVSNYRRKRRTNY